MTVYGVEKRLRYGDYRFEIRYDSGNETGLAQRDITWSKIDINGQWSESKFLRSFYFDEVQLSEMKRFCRHFAEDSDYRAACLTGQNDWSIRNKLYRRNMFRSYYVDPPAVAALGDPEKAFPFFKQYWRAIVTQSEYQRIQQLDTQFDPLSTQLDPAITPAVRRFNEIAGVETKFSCQGVSGTVMYQDIAFLTVSPHAYLAYIWFKTVPSNISDTLTTLATKYTHVEYRYLSGSHYRSFPDRYNLCSTGDNIAFRQEALHIANALLLF
ncbi:MAG: hypothetical protein GYB65_05885 [Chloroflexi bacterium]|nr:hypothetical protein [Chloroflexota bacterium]